MWMKHYTVTDDNLRGCIKTKTNTRKYYIQTITHEISELDVLVM